MPVVDASHPAPVDPDIGLRAPYRVRFDEGTAAGTMRASALLRDAQDIAWRHSDALGFDRHWYAARGLTWLVRGVELSVRAPIPTGIDLTITTRITGYRRVWARRHTTFELSDGTVVAEAITDWVILDGRGQPTRIPEELARRFAEPLPSFAPVRVELPPAPVDALTWSFDVRPQDLDPLAHVNNAAYVDYVDEAIGWAGSDADAAVPRTYRLEYVAAAEPGARIDARAWWLRAGAGSDPGRDVAATRAIRLSTAQGAELLRATTTA